MAKYAVKLERSAPRILRDIRTPPMTRSSPSGAPPRRKLDARLPLTCSREQEASARAWRQPDGPVVTVIFIAAGDAPRELAGRRSTSICRIRPVSALIEQVASVGHRSHRRWAALPAPFSRAAGPRSAALSKMACVMLSTPAASCGALHRRRTALWRLARRAHGERP